MGTHRRSPTPKLTPRGGVGKLAQAQSGDFPHLLVYGPSGAGKKTRVVATLKELYGPGVDKIKIDARVFQTSSNRKLEFNIVASVYHLEITPSDVGKDRKSTRLNSSHSGESRMPSSA